MPMKQVFIFSSLLVAAMCFLSGCVAFNMGAPDRQTYEFKVGKANPVALGRETVEVGPSLFRKPGKGEELGKIDIGLAGDVLLRQKKGDVYHQVTITRQDRMSFGLFPWGAEYYWRPKESLEPMVGWQHKSGTIYQKDTNNRVSAVYFGGAFATPFALLYTPLFGKYECHSHHWKGNIGILAKLSSADREKADINVRSTKSAGMGEFAHCAWLGFHKYQTIVIGPELSGRTDEWEETERRSVKVPGPYKIEFRIPSIGYRKVQTVESGETAETFLLPPVEEDVEVESKIRFFPAETVHGVLFDQNANAVFDAAQGKTFSRNVKLYASASAGGFAPIGGVTTQVVVHVREPVVPFMTEKKESNRKGWSIYRITILDEDKTAFDINKLAKPEILRELRDEYISCHPDVQADVVNAHASYVTDPADGRVLVYSGVAFAVQPVDRMEYDAETRRGTIRLRVSDHLDLKAARAWARENIEKIVSEKNIVLEHGKSLPVGATYRSLDEVLENGILTIGFEAEN